MVDTGGLGGTASEEPAAPSEPVSVVAWEQIDAWGRGPLLEREDSMRSRTSQGVYQELWGILLAYNTVRLEVMKVAKEVNVAPFAC